MTVIREAKPKELESSNGKGRGKYADIVNRLEQLKDREAIYVEVEKYADLTTIRNSARSLGFNISIRKIKNSKGYNLYRVPLFIPPKEEYQQILDRVGMGDTYQKIGDDSGISRQAIEQKGKLAKFSSLNIPPSERKGVVDEFIEPYLEKLDKQGPICLICGNRAHSRRRGVCADCGAQISRVMKVCSRLRTFLKNTENRHYLAQAIQYIRKYDIKPEDLEGN